MNFNWESEKEKVFRWMQVPAKKKLEWLLEMNEFSQKYTPPQNKKIRRKLRALPSVAENYSLRF